MLWGVSYGASSAEQLYAQIGIKSETLLQYDKVSRGDAVRSLVMIDSVDCAHLSTQQRQLLDEN